MRIKKVLLLLFLANFIHFFIPGYSTVYGAVYHDPCTSVAYECDCQDNSLCNFGCSGADCIWGRACWWDSCPCIGCSYEHGDCCPCSGCGGCFTGETEVRIKNSKTQKLQTEKIENLKPGDIVESFDPETGEISEGIVSNIQKANREGYYELETESGKKVKVTGEHPFLALRSENNQTSNSKSQTISKFQNSISKLEEIFSHTLTYKVISGFQSKVSGLLR